MHSKFIIMKKFFIYLFFSAVFAACGETNENTTTGTDNGNQTNTNNNASSGDLTEADVPATVRSAFQQRYQNVTEAEWSKETENDQPVYEVEFKHDNVEKKAYFNETGTFLREKND